MAAKSLEYAVITVSLFKSGSQTTSHIQSNTRMHSTNLTISSGANFSSPANIDDSGSRTPPAYLVDIPIPLIEFTGYGVSDPNNSFSCKYKLCQYRCFFQSDCYILDGTAWDLASEIVLIYYHLSKLAPRQVTQFLKKPGWA